jgi:hypothetical protein
MSNRSDVFEAFQIYLDAFMAGDEQALRDCLQWPCTFLLDSRVETRDALAYNPAELKRKKNWATSTGFEIDVAAVSDSKAHVLLRNCERLRPDGALIERVSAFYAFTKTAGGWKIFAMSGMEFPA